MDPPANLRDRSAHAHAHADVDGTTRDGPQVNATTADEVMALLKSRQAERSVSGALNSAALVAIVESAAQGGRRARRAEADVVVFLILSSPSSLRCDAMRVEQPSTRKTATRAQKSECKCSGSRNNIWPAWVNLTFHPSSLSIVQGSDGDAGSPGPSTNNSGQAGISRRVEDIFALRKDGEGGEPETEPDPTQVSLMAALGDASLRVVYDDPAGRRERRKLFDLVRRDSAAVRDADADADADAGANADASAGADADVGPPDAMQSGESPGRTLRTTPARRAREEAVDHHYQQRHHHHQQWNENESETIDDTHFPQSQAGLVADPFGAGARAAAERDRDEEREPPNKKRIVARRQPGTSRR